MAERRMFAKTIIDSDAFLDMPLSAQALYFHLNMRADDDGFINNPKRIQRIVGCPDDDLKLLIMKNFVITFDSGIIVIKHWKIHNYIQSDRYKPTVYKDERNSLYLKANKAYSLEPPNDKESECIQDVSMMDTQVRLGKVRLDKERNKREKKIFSPPSLEEVQNYCLERNNKINAQGFIDFYVSKDWMVGKNKMKDWKAAIRTWENREKKEIEKNYPKMINDNGAFKIL